jgi:hypothetical protein
LALTGGEQVAKSRRLSIARLVVLSCVLCLGACSGTTFVYNRLDTIVPWYVDDYVDLDGSQEHRLDEELQPFLDWHRAQELPNYVELLDEIDSSLGQSITVDEVAAIYEGIEAAWLRLEEESLDWLLELGESLSDEQVQEFLTYLGERQEEYEEKYLPRTEAEFREETYDSFAESFSDYMGRLDPEQRERLQQASADMERSDSAWLQERAAWLQRLGVMMQREPGWQDRVRESVAARGETVSEGYLETYEHNMQVILSTVADVLNSRSEKQDRRLRGEVAGLREDLQTLIAQGRPAAQENNLAQAQDARDVSPAEIDP